MIITYQLFEVDDSGALVLAKDGYGKPLKGHSSEEEALQEIEYSIKLKEFIILKKMSRDYNLVDDLLDED